MPSNPGILLLQHLRHIKECTNNVFWFKLINWHKNGKNLGQVNFSDWKHIALWEKYNDVRFVNLILDNWPLSVVPSFLQKKMLFILHEGHQSIYKTPRHACDSIYWPGIDREIQKMVKHCHQYLTFLPVNSKEPLKQLHVPTSAWKKLYSVNGNEYIITAI